MAYNNNARGNTLYPRTFYTLYIGPNNNGAGHLILKLLIKQILTTLIYKPVPIPEDLLKTINQKDSLTTNIQINHFDCDYHTTRKDYFSNT